MQSIKTHFFDIMKTIIYSKSYEIRLICTNKKNQEILLHGIVQMQNSNKCPRNTWIVTVIMGYVESLLTFTLPQP